ncbi:MAG: AAA family ATPase, partial [Candidatus Heimdallarchaeota archaeon]
MITSIFLQNFKGFGAQGQNIPMNRITLLFGANSSGKTSIIQALLLLKQTITENRDRSELVSNGSLIALGSFREFIHKHDENNEMKIGLESDFGNKMSFSFHLKDNIIDCSRFEGIAEKWLSENSRVDNWSSIRYQGERIEESHYNVDLINHEKTFGEIFGQEKTKKDPIKEIKRKKHFTQKTIQLLQG